MADDSKLGIGRDDGGSDDDRAAGDIDIEALLRELDAGDLEFDRPPDTVWAAIAGELDLATTPSAASSASDTAGVTSSDDAAASNVVRGRFGRTARWAAPLVAVAAAAVAIVVGVVVTRDDSSTTTVASAELQFQPGFDEAGASAVASADLIDDDGDELIRIDDESLPFDLGEDASLELWLIETDPDGNVVDLVSLGDIDPDGTRQFAIPPGYDPSVFSVVDISVEPHDGDATHSGRSILRGPLSA